MFPPLRDIKRQARRDVHDALRIPVVYLRTRAATPVVIHVRLHNKFDKIGDVQGSRQYPAQIENVQPRIRFDLTEIPRVTDGAVLSFETGEAYVVDHTLQPDGDYQFAYVTRLMTEDTVGLPVVGDDGTTIVFPGAP